MSNQLYDPRAEVILTHKNGKKTTFPMFNRLEWDLQIQFEVPFGSSGYPPKCTVKIYNLSKTHRAMFKKGLHVVLKAGYYSHSVGVLCEGNITSVDPTVYDDNDTVVAFRFTAGTDYSRTAADTVKVTKLKKVTRYHRKTVATKPTIYKHRNKNGKVTTCTYMPKKKAKIQRTKYTVTKKERVNMTFKKGSTVSQVIKGIAKKAGFKFAKMQLKKNPVFKRGYTCHGKPWTVIQELVKKADSYLVNRQGKWYILNAKAGFKTGIVLEKSTSLIARPQRQDEDSAKQASYQIESLLRPELTTQSLIKVKSDELSGTFIVTSGSHTFDGTSWKTTCLITTPQAKQAATKNSHLTHIKKKRK
ncbi:phage protein [Lactiplantibacillus mudanjiangensis]|uniref:Uncharacterized protein n=1 Tax=Lactiplantibacillus mudanjiangensis TaxID=1296538 RepID=A0A660DXD4_9LACO|nr:hypothetical protein [Lactiplantibacillus mudanjiangensis]VDG23660.1 hypothetical protein [Lactobacillus parabuchneri] [Lactiplantibacillus mudanjiangensis]VDG27803.1 hypothetical protein [Lactobacillus parabuchneri] [Lactiplantibacillus mudanjiangensis]